MSKMANYGVTRLGHEYERTTTTTTTLHRNDLSEKSKIKSSQTKRASLQVFFDNRRRAKRIAAAPILSDAEQQLAIKKFLSEGKAKRYPLAATGDTFFAEDKKCISLLEQAITIEVENG